MVTLDQFQKFGRDGMEAAMRSLSVMSGGVQSAATETADFTKRSFEQSAQAAQRLMSARTLDVAVQVQTDYVRKSYEGLVAQTAKMGELATTVAKDAAAPLEGLLSRRAPAA